MTTERFAGRRFEWDDGLPLTPSQQPALATPTAPSKAAAPRHFSRFTVSPAPASRFSITQVSDSDAGSVGGEAAAELAGGNSTSDNGVCGREGHLLGAQALRYF